MTLNFSNNEISKVNLVNINFFLKMPLFLLALNGCSAFYGYQPPAPVHGTNPYAEKSEENITASETVENSNHPQITDEVLSGNAIRPDLNVDSPVVNKPMSPAVLALVTQAETSSKAGDLESAVATIERALRIDSRNPALTYKLAKLRLQQSKPRLAEDLAKKAALLSANDKQLKKKSWLLISEARRQQKNYYGAKEAKLKAEEF